MADCDTVTTVLTFDAVSIDFDADAVTTVVAVDAVAIDFALCE